MVRYKFLCFIFLQVSLACTSLISFSFQDPGEEIDEYQIRVNKILYNVTLWMTSSGPLNQSEATNICMSRRRFHLPVFYSLWEHNRFLDSPILKKRNLSQLWLPQRRQFKLGFEWIDSEIHCKGF